MVCPPEHSGISHRSHLPLGGRAAAAIAVLLFSAAGLWAQASAPDPSNTKPDNGACPQAERTSASPSQAESQSNKGSAEKEPSGPSEDACTSKSKDESEGKQTNRILGVVPNFAAVTANTQLPPFSVKGKFWLATEDSFD